MGTPGPLSPGLSRRAPPGVWQPPQLVGRVSPRTPRLLSPLQVDAGASLPPPPQSSRTMSGFIKNHSAKCSLVPAAAATHFCVASGRATVDGPMRRQGVTSSGPKPQFVRPWWGAWEGSVCPAIGGETDPPVLRLLARAVCQAEGGHSEALGLLRGGVPRALLSEAETSLVALAFGVLAATARGPPTMSQLPRRP